MQVEFVETIPRPEVVADGRLYISLKYNMTMHRCASGCGQLVPLPLSPADWSFSYDGENVSLRPSVGNGLLKCRSHYLIKNGEIVWLSEISAEETLRQQQIDMELLLSRASGRHKGDVDNRERPLVGEIWARLTRMMRW